MMREIKVYNTLTKQKEVFHPEKENEVSIYVCGVTPYNDPHIGNARPFVTWDVIRRFLAKIGYKVHYIQNFTDIDDKIIRVANERRTDWKEVADHYIKEYFTAIDALNVRRADKYPRVSEHIEDIISMIEKLIKTKNAYELNGDIYFRVESFKDYGKLSGRKLDDMMAGARVEINDQKENPMDFALWKAAKPNEPSWDSPWGKGRPGWHIECSTMSLKYLGSVFDFHGGGSDLIFPHHENEIAQSQAFTEDDHSFAHYWLHNGFITVHEEKMSKSAHNFFTVKEILDKYAGEVIRFFILETHYRSLLDFSDERLAEAQSSLQRLKNTRDFLLEMENWEGDAKTGEELFKKAQKIEEDFYQSMADDFNTALALSYMFALSKEINIYYKDVEAKVVPFDKENYQKVAAIYLDMADILGILEENRADSREDNAEIEKLIAERTLAKKEKNWQRADEIRDKLQAQGILLEDTPSGTKWRRA